VCQCSFSIRRREEFTEEIRKRRERYFESMERAENISGSLGQSASVIEEYKAWLNVDNTSDHSDLTPQEVLHNSVVAESGVSGSLFTGFADLVINPPSADMPRVTNESFIPLDRIFGSGTRSE
jgi:hypothetical protein